MPPEAPDDQIITERRKRLAAEQLLAQKAEELFGVNRKLAEHADQLSSQVIVQREENVSLEGARVQAVEERDLAKQKAKRAERRLWDSLEAIQDGFALFDPKWRLVAANGAFMRVFRGIESVGPGITYEELLMLVIEEGLIDTGDEDPEDWVDRMIARWEASVIPETQITLFNGAVLQVREVRTSEGDTVCLIENITGTIRREEALREALEGAEAATRAKSAFLAKMSHEIRTPMNGVVGMADLLIDGGLNEEQVLYAETIKSSAEALLVIINDILDYSKLEAEKLTFYAEAFDLEAMIVELVRLLGVTLKDRPVELFIDYPFDAPSHITADQGRLRQVITNLLGNALKFTKEGYVALRVSVEEDELSIAIEDSGVGIPADHLGAIFGDFNQVENESNRRHEGTGLGLSITRGLVEQMGGTIGVESVEGEGSTFTFTLPLEASTPPAFPPLEGLTVTLVDPLKEAGSALATALRDHGASVDHVATVSEAPRAGPLLVVCRDKAPDLPEDRPVLFLGMPAHLPKLPENAQHRLCPTPCTRADLLTALQALPTDEAPVSTRPFRLLAAEDNKTNQLVFRKMLKTLSLDLTMVENGLLLVEAFEPGKYDAIFTDISMPEMDGREAARRIREIEARGGHTPIPIVAMTAHAMDGDEDDIFAAGINHYMTKPLKKALLIEKLNALCPADVMLEPSEES